VKIERRKPDQQEASRLALDASAEVLVITAAALAADVQIGFERSIIPAGLARHFELSLERGRDVYGALAEEGTFVVRADDTISAITAQAEEETELGIARGQPLLRISRRAFAMTERPVELRLSRYLASAVTYASTSG
jgi:DNA-binding GntR family transcriptional regulator